MTESKVRNATFVGAAVVETSTRAISSNGCSGCSNNNYNWGLIVAPTATVTEASMAVLLATMAAPITTVNEALKATFCFPNNNYSWDVNSGFFSIHHQGSKHNKEVFTYYWASTCTWSQCWLLYHPLAYWLGLGVSFPKVIGSTPTQWASQCNSQSHVLVPPPPTTKVVGALARTSVSHTVLESRNPDLSLSG